MEASGMEAVSMEAGGIERACFSRPRTLATGIGGVNQTHQCVRGMPTATIVPRC